MTNLRAALMAEIESVQNGTTSINQAKVVSNLTTGFNMTNLDCVVLMRATKSTGHYVQMVGRGLRAHDDKAKGCLIDMPTD